MLTREERALLLELHRIVGESSHRVTRAVGEDAGECTYPPEGTEGAWTKSDAKALASLQLTPSQRRALRKVFADHAASVLFQCLSLIDGVTDPQLTPLRHWSGLRLVVRNEAEPAEMLHDAFFDSYADYAKQAR
ncbi:MAG: hypothetical protein R3B07_26420 [Polyangiaceae bacterium]